MCFAEANGSATAHPHINNSLEYDVKVHPKQVCYSFALQKLLNNNFTVTWGRHFYYTW